MTKTSPATTISTKSRPFLPALVSAAIGIWGAGCGRGVLSQVDDDDAAVGADGGVMGGSGGATKIDVGGGSTGGVVATGGAGAVGMDGSAIGGSYGGPNCPCSRRPGENNAFMCPPGTGQASTTTLGTNGGSASLNGTPSTASIPVSLAILPTALGQSVSITITETTTPPPAGYVDESPIYSIAMLPGLTLSTPAKLVLPYQNNLGFISTQLAIYFSTDGMTYTRVQDSYINAGFLQGSLTKSGFVFAGYPQTAADLAACGVSVGKQ
jgi:hypothetical protein